jgi:hypothetical protein
MFTSVLGTLGLIGGSLTGGMAEKECLVLLHVAVERVDGTVDELTPSWGSVWFNTDVVLAAGDSIRFWAVSNSYCYGPEPLFINDDAVEDAGPWLIHSADGYYRFAREGGFHFHSDPLIPTHGHLNVFFSPITEGIADQAGDGKAIAYANGQVRISGVARGQMLLLNAAGQELLRYSLLAVEKESWLPVGELSPGTYMVRILGDKEAHTLRFIVP